MPRSPRLRVALTRRPAVLAAALGLAAAVFLAITAPVAASAGVGSAGVGSAGAAAVSAVDLAWFAAAGRPQWNLARANQHDTCSAAAAIDDLGRQHPGAALKGFPVAGQGGCPGGHPGFPTYYTAKECSATEVRVVYTIYLPKDGFTGNVFGNALGHRHDFEHVILVWNRAEDGSWRRDHLLLSRHHDHVFQGWATAESWDADRISAGLGRAFPRIFVGWASHAMFNHQGGLKDLVSQYTNNEYRQADYRFWADDLREVTDTNGLAAAFDSYGWGAASSTPAVMSRQLCSVQATA